MSWSSSELVEVRTNPNGERGVFSKIDIKKDAVVAVFDGRAVTLPIRDDGSVDYGEENPHMLIHLAVADRTLFALGPVTPDDIGGVDYMNHSCEPNCYVERALVVRAKNDIPRGTELTWDYRETDLIPQGIPCWCDDPKCVL